jgi:hypothetical protein
LLTLTFTLQLPMDNDHSYPTHSDISFFERVMLNRTSVSICATP